MTQTPAEPAGSGLAAGRRAYLDAASTEPLHPAARAALEACLERGWADPTRLYAEARTARMLLDNARAALAEVWSARPDEVVVTGSGTAAVHAGVLGLLLGRTRSGGRLVHTAVEHSAVFAAARWWEAWAPAGLDVRAAHVAEVEPSGSVDTAALRAALAEPTAVLAVQSANGEVGTLQPLEEVYALAGDVPVFVDDAAAAGRVPLAPGWAAVSASAHHWGGPAGVGVLLVRKGSRWRAPFPTDDRVDPRAAGFENVPAVLAAAAALQAVVGEREETAQRQRTLVDRIRATAAALPDVEVVGHADRRLPHVVTFSCLYLDGESLVTEMDRRGFAVGSGSACTAAALEPSHVLAAMGALTHGNVRVSLARDTTEDDVSRFLAVLPEVLETQRALALGRP